MVKNNEAAATSPEIQAITIVYGALKPLSTTLQERILRIVAELLGVSSAPDLTSIHMKANSNSDAPIHSMPASEAAEPTNDETDGINSVALKWMKRSGLDSKSLQKIFSLGLDDIDLVAKSIPGTKKKERMHNVLLLKGIAAYLGTGAARITHEEFKEACIHYDAYDVSNFAAYMNSFAAEAGGTKEAGYTLTARGLAAGTDLVKSLTA